MDFDSLVRNSRQCLQIAGNNKIRAINRQKYGRSKKRIQVNALKKIIDLREATGTSTEVSKKVAEIVGV